MAYCNSWYEQQCNNLWEERIDNLKKKFAHNYLKENNFHNEYNPCCRFKDEVSKHKNFYPDILTHANGETLIIECKYSKPDFNTGWGKGFNADYNYIWVPSELVGYVINKIPDYVGVLQMTDYHCEKFEVVRKAKKHKHKEWEVIKGYWHRNDYLKEA